MEEIVKFLHKHPNKKTPSDEDRALDKKLDLMHKPPLTAAKIAFFSELILNNRNLRVDPDPETASFTMEHTLTPPNEETVVYLYVSQAAMRVLERSKELLEEEAVRRREISQSVTQVSLSTTDSGRLLMHDEEYDPSIPFIVNPAVQDSIESYNDINDYDEFNLNSERALALQKDQKEKQSCCRRCCCCCCRCCNLF
jgi:hypothetical protein